ncbi:GIY-YIG nuclease family protein [Maribellus sediminis]|uniref:GIY-YIG nuclease family protein n=1 Tax=Maribellus sediminis TaxID=2696285 RepID=UPI001431C639
MTYYLYILQSEKNGRYYVGSTQNVNERLQQHNWSRTPSTKSGTPWKLVYTEEFSDRSLAIQREYEIKRKKSRKYKSF